MIAAPTDAARSRRSRSRSDAGAAILAIYDSDFAVEHKDDRSPLTAADLAAHRCIVDGLARADARTSRCCRRNPRTRCHRRCAGSGGGYWLVDPLDGTREFVKRNGEFTVNIALIEDGVAGVRRGARRR